MMDEQLFGEASTMAHTFERKSGTDRRSDQQGDEGDATGGPQDVDVDLNLLKNLLESHSQSLGMPLNPASAMLAQFGLALPTPPPMQTLKKKKSESGEDKASD